MSSSNANFKIALIQLNVTADKTANIDKALKYVQTAKENGAEIAVLPECFNGPYGTKFFSKYAEEIPAGETCRRLSECAKKLRIYIVGGSIPEIEGDRLYNTCAVWNPQGELIAKHRKMHLFDIDVPGEITFKESDSFSPGNDVTIFETDKCKVGLGICHDVRFPELANIYRKLGCSLLIYPGAFTMSTGLLLWELLFRARACDNQLFVAGVSPARDMTADYHTWGHSIFVNPLAQVEAEAEHDETIIYGVVGFKVALIQLNVTADKPANVDNAVKYVQTAKENAAEIAILPECFNSPYGTKFFPKYAEEVPTGETCRRLSECARKCSIYIVGGSIPEIEGDRLYNTCTVWNPQGKLIAKHRKMHLFDIDIPGKITFKESDALSPGNDVTTFETEKCKIGLGICYDVRFPELANIYRKLGCSLLIYPGAFNMTTGPLHWELLFRARACDNQLFVAGVSPARDVTADYHAWGHSIFVNPLAQVEAHAEHDETIIYGTVDLAKIAETRQNIPILVQRRTDIYDVLHHRL